MGVIKRKRIWKEHAGMAQNDEELLERALRFVDTRGVVMRAAEADLRAAIAEHRAHPTPERERRVEEARRAFEEAKNTRRRLIAWTRSGASGVGRRRCLISSSASTRSAT